MGEVIKKYMPFTGQYKIGVLHAALWSAFTLLSLVVCGLSIDAPWYLLYPGVIGVILCAILLVKYEFGVYLLPFTIPITGGNIGFLLSRYISSQYFPLNYGDRIGITTIIVIFPFIGYTLAKWSKVKEFNFENPFKFPLLIFLFYASLTAFYGMFMAHSLISLFILLMNILMFSLVVGVVEDERMHRKLMWCFLISGAAHGITVIGFYFLRQHFSYLLHYDIVKGISFIIELQGGYQAFETPMPRRGSTFTYPHETAMIMNIIFAIAIGLFITEKSRRRKALILAIIPILIAVNLLAMSRAGVGSMLIMVFFMAFAIERLRRHFIAITSAFLIVMGSIFFAETMIQNWALNTSITPRILVEGLKFEEGGQNLSPARARLWKSSYAEFKHKKLTGVGIGNLTYILKIPHAHSIYFSVLFDFGLIGFAILAAMMLILLKRFWDFFMHYGQDTYSKIMTISMAGALIAIGVHGFVDFEYNRLIIWLVIAATIVTLNLAKRDYLSKAAPNIQEAR